MEPRQTVLIVDDTAENLSFLGELLRAEYAVRAANSGARALDLAVRDPRPDLILLDIMMPGLSGFDVLEQLKQAPATSDIPVIFATAMDSKDDERKGLVLGAVDYVTKPLHPSVVLARVRTHLRLKQERDGLEQLNDSLQTAVTRGAREKQIAQDVTFRALARLAEARDNETGAHILRTQQLVLELARRASAHPRFACELDPSSIELIAKSAPLHDIGKVGVPDRVLLKPDVGLHMLMLERSQQRRLRAEQANRERRLNYFALMQSIADGSDDAIFAKDRAGRYLFCNRAAGLVMRKPVTDMLGRDDSALFPPTRRR